MGEATDGTIPVSAADILAELAERAARSVDARARLGEFLDTKPIIAALEIDDVATMRAGRTIVNDKPTQQLIDCLLAIRALDKQGDGFGGV
jgi:hypothetical protein